MLINKIMQSLVIPKINDVDINKNINTSDLATIGCSVLVGLASIWAIKKAIIIMNETRFYKIVYIKRKKNKRIKKLKNKYIIHQYIVNEKVNTIEKSIYKIIYDNSKSLKSYKKMCNDSTNRIHYKDIKRKYKLNQNFDLGLTKLHN